MRTVKNLLRKLVIMAVGFPMLIVGIILVPLPGPGVLISLLAFFILSFEFNWADKGFREAKLIIKKIYESARDRAAKIDSDLSKS